MFTNKLKRKRQRFWCPGGKTDLGFTYNQKNRDTKPEHRPIRHIRCPRCGQRFEVENRECHDFGCIHQYVPLHKTWKLKREKGSKDGQKRNRKEVERGDEEEDRESDLD